MPYYYVLTNSRSSSFLLERRLSHEGVICELTFIPRELTSDLCNMGVRFFEHELPKAVPIIKHSGLPGCKIFKEIPASDGSLYKEIFL